MKYPAWNKNSVRPNPYASYAQYPQGYQQPAGPAFPSAIDWARVLWPNGWYLTPAIIGFLGASALGFAAGCDVNSKTADVVTNGKAALMSNVYTLIATAGISLYIVENLFSFIGRFWLTLSSIIVGTLTATVLYASMYFYLYRTNPANFSSNYLGHHVFEQYYSFIYFSATTITVGAFGDILPVTFGTRTLVNMEVMFFLFILTSGVSAMSQIKQR